MLTKTQLTAQELHRWLGLVEDLTERYAKNTPEDDAKFMAIHRLVDDVERWKKEASELFFGLPGRVGAWAPAGRFIALAKELRDYRYSGEGE